MRIVAGTFRSRRLVAPTGHDTRPTSDRAREALFAMLAEVGDARVLDCFAGSGDWADAVHALLAQPEPPRVMPTNGAEVVADRILSLVSGG